VFDFSFSLTNTYTFWSGLIGGTFLQLSYFGTDQSQVQRYLSAKSVDEARSSLLISAYWKIPLQALVLLVGVLVFAFYQYHQQPLLFNPAHERAVRRAQPAVYAQLERQFAAAPTPAARDSVRTRALDLATTVTGQPSKDVNYVIPRFVLEHLPIGLAGIFIAAVIAAAMNAISGELMSLSTASVVDFYRRWIRAEGPDSHYLIVSRMATAVWGLFACVVATYAVNLGSLIEVVNRFGSFFYGSILGVFLLGMLPRANATGAFFGLIAGMVAVAAVNFGAPSVAFLWHNVVGAVTVVAVGSALSAMTRGSSVAFEDPVDHRA
jgi:Na+/proline symporter